MKLRTELLFYTIGLAALNLLLAFGVIGLFTRMGPAIERILNENMASIEAAEQMLAVFAAHPGELPAEARTRVNKALEAARANVTEAEERPVLDRLERNIGAALDGEAEARQVVLADLGALIDINREAMTVVDLEARRLGSAGAWAAVFIGALSFGFSLLVVSLLRRRLLEPLLEIHETLRAAQRGDRFRRCRGFDAAVELKQAGQALNVLLDERLKT